MSPTTFVHATAAALLILTPGTSWSQAPSNESCSVTAEPSRRLELPDGRIVSIDVKNVVRSAGSIVALGRYMHVFPASATLMTSPVEIDSTIGVIIDSRGVVRLLPSPFRDRSVSFARAAAGPSGSFHVLFTTGIQNLNFAPAPDDTATIWYARLENGRWRSLERITATLGAALNTEFTTDLLERAGSLAFVFPFIDRRNEETGGGLIALRRRSGRWSSDTVRTHRIPSAVRARLGADGALYLLFSQHERGVKGDDVYLTRPGDDAKTRQRISARSRGVSDLALVTIPGGMAASWGTWQWANAATNVVEWSRVGDGARPLAPTGVDSGAATYPFEFFAADSHLVWFYHGEPFDAFVRFAVAPSGGGRLQRGSLTIPFSNAQARAVGLTADRTLLFTMKFGRAQNEPMGASWTTVVRIRCPSPARR